MSDVIGRAIVAGLFGFLIGAALGSYWGVVADRGWKGSLSGRSRCDGCGRTLTWPDLIPIASYLALRGRCRSCGARLPAALLGRELVAATVAGSAAALATLLISR